MSNEEEEGVNRRHRITRTTTQLARSRVNGPPAWVLTGLVFALPMLVAACGSSPSPQSSEQPTTAAVTATCQQVTAALSDGPDPGSDPLGYALAQVEPLRAIHTTDKSLERAIDGLAFAYQTFYDDNGTKSVGAAVTAAGKAVDKFCPEATS